jgi:psp operon transcriptional activator
MDYIPSPQEALGESEPFLEFQQQIGLAARVDRPVLVIGERGSGKELAASRLHFLSSRWNAPFVALNCAALSPGLIESELFGHESGSFTGATGQRKGRFEEADSGTLFLDEIGLIPIEVQEKILRAVEYGTFQRVGSSRTVEVNVRIIGATNQDLPELCESGSFKRDLLDRLSFEVLFIPPLRERGDDLLKLADHFAVKMSRELGRDDSPLFSDPVRRLILNHTWPGNIRELKNAVERAVYREDGPLINDIIIDPFHNPWNNPGQETEEPEIAVSNPLWPIDLKGEIRELEERRLLGAMKEAEDHQGKAAELLGLSYDQFRGLFRKINPE